MDHHVRDNPYLALDLDPSVDDWATIQARLDEKQREWSRQAVSGSPAKQQEAKVNLKLISDMTRRLKDPEERVAIRTEARKIKTARAAEAWRRLEAHIELLRTKGFYKREDLGRLHQDLGGDLSKSEIEGKLSQSGLLAADAPDHTPSRIPPRPYINPTVQGEIRRLLDQLGLKTLYDLLKISRRTDLDSLSRLADEVYRYNRPLTDPDSTARSKLAGHAKNVFSNAAEKEKYDNTIDVEAIHRLHGLIDTAGLSGLISTDALDQLVQRAVKSGVNPDDARSYIEEYAAKKKWLVQPAGRPPAEKLKVCGYCSTLARTTADTKCPNCKEHLEVPCPRCGTSTPTERERCTNCGFPTGSIPYLEGLLRSGRRLMNERRYEDAVGQLDQALLIYDQWEPARTEKQRANAALEEIAAAERDVNALVDAGRLVHASGGLALLDKRWGPERWVALRNRVEERLSRARTLIGEGEQLLREGGVEAAWLKFDEALGLSGDLEEARAAKAKCPPPPPLGLEVKLLSSGFGLAWSGPAAGGQISFRLLRKEGSAPRDSEDGTTLPTQVPPGVTWAEDVHAPVGRAWHYAIFSVRDGLVSREGAAAGPVIRTSEVEALRASIGNRRVTLSWRLPEGARSVEVRRRPEGARDSSAWSPPLAVRSGDSRFIDAGLENEVTYRYRVAAIFFVPGRGEITSAGREVLLTPSGPPGRVVDLKIDRDRRGLRLSWEHIVEPGPSIIVIRSPERPTWETGHILPLSRLSTLGRCLVEVGQREASDPAPDPFEAYYSIYATNRLLAAYCGTVLFAEVRDLHASREDGQIILRWGWPDGCTAVEVTSSPDGHDMKDDGTSHSVVRRNGKEPTGLVRLPIDGLVPGRRTFSVRCQIDAGAFDRAAGPGRTVNELVSRSRELRWALKRSPFGLVATRLVIETDDLSGLERLRLVGKVNERPTSPDDGRCLLDWRPTGQSAVLPPLVLTVGAPRALRGETFCRLFIESSDLIRIDDPPVDQTVL
jgi:hypothetical protein